jgi:hypothetical protein
MATTLADLRRSREHGSQPALVWDRSVIVTHVDPQHHLIRLETGEIEHVYYKAQRSRLQYSVLKTGQAGVVFTDLQRAQQDFWRAQREAAVDETSRREKTAQQQFIREVESAIARHSLMAAEACNLIRAWMANLEVR